MKTEPNEPINHISEAEKDRLDEYPNISFKGLTKREYFSALNLQAFITASMSSPEMAKIIHSAAEKKNMQADDYLAKESVSMADKLIKALNS